MKKRLIGDALVYFIAPVVLFSIFKGESKIYSLMTTTMILIAYSMIIKYNQFRFNFSGLFFSIGYTFMQSLKIGLNEPYHIYIYNIYCLIIVSIFIVILNLVDRNIFKQIYIDILKILNFSQIQIINSIKKNNLYKEFYKLTSTVIIHILILILVKSHSVFSLGKTGYLNNLNIEASICIIFFIGEAVLISKFIKNTKYILTKSNIKNIKFVTNESKIININKYKNINK
jgi:hypothetical protein